MRTHGRSALVVLAVGCSLTLGACGAPSDSAALAGLGGSRSAAAGSTAGAADGDLTYPETDPSAAASSAASQAGPSVTLRAAPRAARPSTAPTPGGAGTSKKPDATRQSQSVTALGSGAENATEAEVVRLTNAARAKAGCRPLTVNAVLVRVARAHSKDMAVNGYFDHASLNGRSPFDRMKAAGYSFRAAAENIAAGQPTPAEVMKDWMNSPGHRENIENCSLTQIGVGVYSYPSSPYRIYWTQDFGTPL